MRTRKRYPDNPGVMYADCCNVLRLGYRGCATQGYKTIIGESFKLKKAHNCVHNILMVIWPACMVFPF